MMDMLARDRVMVVITVSLYAVAVVLMILCLVLDMFGLIVGAIISTGCGIVVNALRR